MAAFVLAYALAFLLWRSQSADQWWWLLYAVLWISVWLALYLRYRRRRTALPLS